MEKSQNDASFLTIEKRFNMKVKDYIYVVIESIKDSLGAEPRQYIIGAYSTKEKANRIREHYKGTTKGSTFRVKELEIIE